MTDAEGASSVAETSLLADLEAEEEEEHVKRSPVPLPDASALKSILHQFGVDPVADRARTKERGSLSNSKKVLRYADGVLPGQGSPDHQQPHQESPVLPPQDK